MKEVIRYQADSGKVYDSKDEAITDDEELVQSELNDIVVLDDQESFIIARYILINFTRKESV